LPRPSPSPWRAASEFVPTEGSLLLVRLRDRSYRFGMVLRGTFAGYEHHAEEFVTFAHPDRITHCMVIVPPKEEQPEEEAQTPQAESAAPSIQEAALAAGAEADDEKPDPNGPETVYS
jgi:hypothetical protein